MKKWILFLTIMLVVAGTTHAATEQQKQAAIDAGLAWLANSANYNENADEIWFSYSNNGELAATASAALAFIEEGYLPGSTVATATTHEQKVAKMCNYIFNRAKVDTLYPSYGTETAVYTRIAEDYDNSEAITAADIAAGANDQAIFFDPANYKRDVYTNGIVVPVIHALGEAYGKDTLVGMGSTVVSGMTYKQVMQDVVDWFSYGQVEPNVGIYGDPDFYRGGWRYTPNYSSSDNSTAQWGALPMLYAQEWGLGQPDYVANELNLWVNTIQNSMTGDWKDGGSGYENSEHWVNMAKTGGLLLQLKALEVPVTDARVQNALAYIQSTVSFNHWNEGPGGWGDQWNGGHLGNAYAMWATYKALEVWNIDTISTAPGGFTIGQDWAPTTSAAGDWYSHYCDFLINNGTYGQHADGSWTGYSYWYGALANGWYINILNAAGVPGPQPPVPAAVLLGLLGLGTAGMKLRNRRHA